MIGGGIVSIELGDGGEGGFVYRPISCRCRNASFPPLLPDRSAWVE